MISIIPFKLKTNKNIPIVGFSATPLRTGKEDLSKLREVYLNEQNLNNEDFPLLTNYSMVYAISNKLILPPEFYWYHVADNKDKKNIYYQKYWLCRITWNFFPNYLFLYIKYIL